MGYNKIPKSTKIICKNEKNFLKKDKQKTKSKIARFEFNYINNYIKCK